MSSAVISTEYPFSVFDTLTSQHFSSIIITPLSIVLYSSNNKGKKKGLPLPVLREKILDLLNGLFVYPAAEALPLSFTNYKPRVLQLL